MYVIRTYRKATMATFTAAEGAMIPVFEIGGFRWQSQQGVDGMLIGSMMFWLYTGIGEGDLTHTSDNWSPSTPIGDRVKSQRCVQIRWQTH